MAFGEIAPLCARFATHRESFFYFVEDGFSCSYRINQIMQKPIVAQVQMNLVKEERKAEHSFRTINKNWKKMF